VVESTVFSPCDGWLSRRSSSGGGSAPPKQRTGKAVGVGRDVGGRETVLGKIWLSVDGDERNHFRFGTRKRVLGGVGG